MEHIDPSCGMEPYSQDIFTDEIVKDTFGPIQVPLGSTVPSLSEEIPRNYDLPPFASGVTLAYQADATETAASELLLPSPVPRTGPRFESYTDDIWEVHKPRIRELYIEKNKKLREVMQHMTEEKGFKPSMSMYKTRLVAWGFFKNNREKDVTALLRLKQTRDVAGKSSVIFRAGKPVNEHQILNYLRRKRMNPQDLVSGEENDDQIPISDHICVRTPSPTLSAHLSLPSGNIRDGEAMLLSVKYWYTVWIGETCRLRDGSIPDHFQLAEVGGSNIVDCVSLLLRLGCRLLRHKRFVEGGAYVQGGFVIVENLLREMGDVSRGSKQSPVWIFGLWKLLMEKVPIHVINVD
ncbi:Clr5 domain-containing protein [Phialemonium atrogriseum]|uniref:Clr5 domain-containing protein n=1 Tax=Phialemonium atrogriseum TaxID=1093897 RepID=A0AAJ0BP31_9PEZI|nr:Clr5 domain-containing protein [Phialemonium atrogriseum]KAK1761716.1 Clr5 domain-containing protein [Phialemonium atrogriseum]